MLAAAALVRPLLSAKVSANLPNSVLVAVVAGTFIVALLVVRVVRGGPVSAAIPVAAAFATAALQLLLWAADTHIYLDADIAAEAFRDQQVRDVRTTGGFVFGSGSDGKAHVAMITPRLVRALARHAIDLEAVPPRAFPMPGLLPLVAALAIALYAVLRGRGERAPAVRARAAMLYGLLTLYMAWWFTDAARLPMWLDHKIQSAYYVQHVVLAVAGLGFTIFGSRKLADDRLSDAARAGWSALFFSVPLILMAGMYLVFYQTPGTPALFWLLLYIIIGALVWWATVPAARMEVGS
jgi:hypothetical protein